MNPRNEILIVDDTAENLKLLADTLIAEGYKVRPTQDPLLAIESARAMPPDLILLDIRMPGMDGFEACEKLKQDERTAEVPIIFVSALQDTDDRVQGFQVGGVDFITKPIQREEVLARVQVQLELLSARNELEQRVQERTAELADANHSLEIQIAKQVETEATLRESEKNYRLVVENVPAGIAQFDLEQRHSFTNQQYTAFFECPASQIIGRHIKEVLGDALYQSESEAIQRVLDGHQVNREFEVIHVGEQKWFSSTYVPKYDGKGQVDGFYVLLVDIDDRKRAEAAVRLDEERLGALLKLSQMQDASEEKLAEYALEEGVRLTGSQIGFLHFINPQDHTIRLSKCSKVVLDAHEPDCSSCNSGIQSNCIALKSPFIQNHVSSQNIEHPEQGEHLPILRYMSVPVVEEDEVVAVIEVGNKQANYNQADVNQLSLFMDGMWSILMRQKAAGEREQLERNLQQSQKMEAIGTLAGGIAHDFNNILNIILGYTSLAKEDAYPGSALANDLEQVLIAGNQAKNLIKQILAFSRQSPQERIPIHIHLVVNEAVKLLKASIPSTISIKTNIDDRAGCVLADSTQINQIVMNLCTNAYHAMRDSGGELTVALHSIVISQDDIIHYRKSLKAGPYIRLSVNDTGHGMDEETMKHIFDPYFTTKKKGEGTGLGLATVHGIVKNSEGHVSVYSEKGKGTSFQIYLPQLCDDDQQADEHEEVCFNQTGNERIWVVDDDPIISQMTRDMLERLGYEVRNFTDSAQILSAFEAEPHATDMIITDMTMPEITGAELSSRLLAIRPDILIVLCTGFSELIDKEEAKTLGIQEFIMKPIVKSELAQVVRKVLDRNKVPSL